VAITRSTFNNIGRFSGVTTGGGDITYAAGDDRCLDIKVGIGDTDTTVTSVTVEGVAATQVVAATPWSPDNTHRTYIYRFLLGSSGSTLANQTITVNTAIAAEFFIAVQQLHGVDQTTPCRTPGAHDEGLDQDPITITVTSVAGDMVTDVVMFNSATAGILTVDASQTQVLNTANSDTMAISYETATGTTTVMSWANTGSENQSQAGVAFIPSGGAGVAKPALFYRYLRTRRAA
jgi:hypothetical protein